MKNPYQLADEEDPQLINSLTPGTSQQMAPVTPQALPPLASPAMAPKTPVVQVPPPMAPPAQLPGMPPGIGASDLEGYLNKQRTNLNKYGPDQQMELQNNLNERRNSLGYKVADAGKGFADALMMGVAGAGNPGWQNQFEAQENQYGKDQMDTLRGADESQTKKTQAGMTLDQMNPESELSKSAQANYAPLFAKLGYPPGKLKGMSAANIDSALQLMTAYGGKEMEAQIKEYELEIEKMRLGAALSKQSSDEKIATDKNKADIAKDVMNAKNSRILGVPIPFTNPASGSAQDAAAKVIDEQLGNSDDTKEPPYGQTTTRGGVLYEWSPVTGKYHKKQ